MAFCALTAIKANTQYGTRVNQTRVDKSVGGGGTREFGKLREDFERAVQGAGWEFVNEMI
jgi:hypothetical protein